MTLKRLVLVATLLMVIVLLAGCDRQATFSLPPLPEQVKGSLVNQQGGEKLSAKELVREWVRFNQNDLAELKRIAAIADMEERRRVAFEQWQELWGVYKAWRERGGYLLGKTGILVYGPVASGWMNEILTAMLKREVIMDGGDLTHVLAERTPRQPEKPADATAFKDYDRQWYELAGLTGEANHWAGMLANSDIQLASDMEAVNQLKAFLKASPYPFLDGLFDGTEIYFIPAVKFYSDLGQDWSGSSSHVIKWNGPYSPEALQYRCRIITLWAGGLTTYLPHELGHAWFFNQYYNPGRLPDIYATYVSLRKPAVPDKLPGKPDEFLSDLRLANLEKEKNTLPWEKEPCEVLPEDFARLFFPEAVTYEWQHEWPNIFRSGDSYGAIRQRLREWFSTLKPRYFAEYRSLKIDPVPRRFKHTLTITGAAPPGARVELFAFDTKEYIDKTTAGADGKFELNVEKAGHFAVVSGNTWKEVMVKKLNL